MFEFIFYRLARVRVDGLNLFKIFKKLSKANIEMKSIKKTSHKQMFFTVKAKSVKKLKLALAGQGYKIKIQRYYGIPFITDFLKRRVGILIGIVLFVITTLILNNYVWKIEVYGVENITRTQIVETLSETGVEVGKPFTAKKVENVENYVQQNLEQISMISIIKKGTSVIVNLKEVRTPEVLQEQNIQDSIISDYEAVITKINVVQGTPLVAKGSIVKKGDTLIAGYFENINGERTYCKAIGEVFAKIYYTSSVTFNTREIKMYKTGEYSVKTEMSLFNNKFRVKDTNNPYNNYEKVCKTKYLYKNNLIPFKIHKTIYYQTQAIEVEQDFDANKDNLVNKALILAKEKMPKHLISINEFTTTEKNDNLYIIAGFVECETQIGSDIN